MEFHTHEAAVGWLKERLAAWGATRINYTENGAVEDAGQIDFETQFPGDQPILSSFSLDRGKVEQAAIRYGVLDGALFPTPPSRSHEQLDRLKMIATRSGVPDVGSVIVNYGDVGRDPRPHLLLGWESAYYGDYTKVTFDDPAHNYPPDTVWEVTKNFGENVLREFRNEWAGGSERQ